MKEEKARLGDKYDKEEFDAAAKEKWKNMPSEEKVKFQIVRSESKEKEIAERKAKRMEESKKAKADKKKNAKGKKNA